MRHPLEFVPDPYRRRLFLICLALTLILFGVFQVLDQPLRTEAAPNGIVSFELAGNPAAARAITDSWKQMSILLSAVAGQPDPNIVNIPYLFAAFGLGLDYLFMPAYAFTLAFAGLLAARKHEGWVKHLGTLAGYAAFAAVLFDAVENYALLQVLSGKSESTYPAQAAFCAVIKFSLIAFSLVYALSAWMLPKDNQ